MTFSASTVIFANVIIGVATLMSAYLLCVGLPKLAA